MDKRLHNTVTFKPYHQHQTTLLPPSLEELIPSNHLVRVVSDVIDQMKITELTKGYKGGGTSSYHPKMMLKVLIYAYTQRIYSCRQIAKSVRENIHYMWLAGQNQPDFRTINRFRSSRLKGTIQDVFSQIVFYLHTEGLVEFKDYFLDGTKIEANANKYTFVWAKSTQKYKARLHKKVRELFDEIDAINEAEDEHYGDKDLPEMGEDSTIDSEKIKELARKIDEQLQKNPEDKNLLKAQKKVREDYLPRQLKYEDHERKFKGRNSYSKTDEDATFMRMKEDHMRNGQLKAGYNIQMGTENQFILGYSIHQSPGDSPLLPVHLEHFQRQYGKLPTTLIADAGYGSEENYQYLESHEITGYVKYNNFHYEQKRKFKNNPYRVENLPYDKDTDSYQCPAGKQLEYTGTKLRKNHNGYRYINSEYQCTDCTGCTVREECHGSKYDRTIRVNPRLNRYRKRARDLLMSEKGLDYRSRRPIEVESVFGQIKNNGQFRRFSLRGVEKVEVEYGLLAIAHNLKKLWAAQLPDTTKTTEQACSSLNIPSQIIAVA